MGGAGRIWNWVRDEQQTRRSHLQSKHVKEACGTGNLFLLYYSFSPLSLLSQFSEGWVSSEGAPGKTLSGDPIFVLGKKTMTDSKAQRDIDLMFFLILSKIWISVLLIIGFEKRRYNTGTFKCKNLTVRNISPISKSSFRTIQSQYSIKRTADDNKSHFEL